MTKGFLRERVTAAPAAVQIVCFALFGAFAALGQPPLGAWGATLLGFAAVFFWVPLAVSARQAGVGLWAFGTAYFIVALRWLVEPFQIEADLYGWMAPFALILMSAGLALFWGLAGWGAVRLSRNAEQGVLALVLTISLAELARAYVLTGFPWAGIAQIWVDTPVAFGLAKIGPHGIAVLTLMLAALPVAAGGSVVRRAVAMLVLLAVMFGVLPWRVNSGAPYDATSPIIRIVQPNAPQHQKWDPEFAATFFWRQVEATRAAGDPDLIVWPETAIPQLLNHADETLRVVQDAAGEVPVVLGMQRADENGYYNALLVLEDGAVTQIYDKHHLVPFGEYMPMQWFFGLLGIDAIAQRFDTGYTAGPGPRLIDLGPLGRALPLICYEAVFPQHARSPEGRPTFLLQITNDAWFGTYAGPQQHLAQARMRAIEQGLPMVRAANTGISAMIDTRGRVTASLPLGEHGFVDAPLPMATNPSLYARTGDWPVAVLLLIALSVLVYRRLTNNSD